MATCYMCAVNVRPGHGARVDVIVQTSSQARWSAMWRPVSRQTTQKQLLCGSCHASYQPPVTKVHPVLWLMFWPLLIVSPVGAPLRRLLAGSWAVMGKLIIAMGALVALSPALPNLTPQSPEPSLSETMGIAVVLIALGVWLTRRKGSATSNSPRRVSLTDAQILRVAQAQGGGLTLSVAVIELGAPVEQLRDRLDNLASQGVCTLEISDDGIVSYHFAELAQ